MSTGQLHCQILWVDVDVEINIQFLYSSCYLQILFTQLSSVIFNNEKWLVVILPNNDSGDLSRSLSLALSYVKWKINSIHRLLNLQLVDNMFKLYSISFGLNTITKLMHIVQWKFEYVNLYSAYELLNVRILIIVSEWLFYFVFIQLRLVLSFCNTFSYCL